MQKPHLLSYSKMWLLKDVANHAVRVCVFLFISLEQRKTQTQPSAGLLSLKVGAALINSKEIKK